MSEILVISSFPDQEQARQIGTALVEKQLAACVNLLPSVESIFRWEGKVERADEVLAFIKTTTERYPELEAEIRDLHPYELPAIIAIDIHTGLPEYLQWISGNL
ncbi:MAG: divalent-cation tolerance protein CutA [Verrucomicrobiales bacterium]